VVIVSRADASTHACLCSCMPVRQLSILLLVIRDETRPAGMVLHSRKGSQNLVQGSDCVVLCIAQG
jgi:hypothetical protein